MMKKNYSGSYSPRQSISMNNPQVKNDGDWWDELCKTHGAKNHWKKKDNKRKKIK
jgi:hypothetical protein